MSDAKIMPASGRPERSQRAARLQRLRQLDRLLWLCWLGAPVSIAWAYWSIVGQAVDTVGSTAEGAACLKFTGHPSYMSLAGKAIFWGSFLLRTSVFFIVLGVFHRMVRKFISGEVFAGSTLAGLKFLGWFLVAWAFLAAAARYAEDAALRAIGDLPPDWPLPIAFNFAAAAVGLFLLALNVVIEYAIELKSDQDLTI